MQPHQVASFVVTTPALAEETYSYELRNRNGNKQALIRDDFWYMMGKVPPRKLEKMAPDDPKWNAWGSCQTETGNSCTYVPLKQKIPAYSKYAFNIARGAKEYQQIGQLLQKVDQDETAWERASVLVSQDTSPPPPAVDALLKMVLFATAFLTTPNYTGLSKELQMRHTLRLEN